LLEVRIGTFSSTAKKIIDEEEEKEDRASLELEVSQMNRKWSSFHREVGETRQLIDLSIDYFTLVEEVEQSFRTGSQVLVTVARKSTQVKTPEEAHTLLREVDGFIKPQEVQLEHKITKISQLAIQLYGFSKLIFNYNFQFNLIFELSRPRKFQSHPAGFKGEPEHAGLVFRYEFRAGHFGHQFEGGRRRSFQTGRGLN
jgi:hypothetical protein